MIMTGSLKFIIAKFTDQGHFYATLWICKLRIYNYGQILTVNFTEINRIHNLQLKITMIKGLLNMPPGQGREHLQIQWDQIGRFLHFGPLFKGCGNNY